MSTTQKRTTIALTKQDLRELDELAQYFGENTSGVIRRAVILLHYITFTSKDANHEFRK
jgi:Ribbon-helix-helix protein, copG family